MLISNTDDHLRNHGFLRTSSAGWSLSPAFDLNPTPEGEIKQLATAIDARSTLASVTTALNVAGLFGLSEREAREVLGEVLDATGSWREVAAATAWRAPRSNAWRPPSITPSARSLCGSQPDRHTSRGGGRQSSSSRT